MAATKSNPPVHFATPSQSGEDWPSWGVVRARDPLAGKVAVVFAPLDPTEHPEVAWLDCGDFESMKPVWYESAEPWIEARLRRVRDALVRASFAATSEPLPLPSQA